jgi:anti-sigma factor ChrR (cupin superfamily)
MLLPPGVPAACLCTECGEFAISYNAEWRKLDDWETEHMTRHPAYETIIAPTQQLIRSYKKARNAVNN